MLQAYLDRFIKKGRLTVRVHPRTTWVFGEPEPSDGYPDVAFWVDSGWTATKIAANPYLHFGEAYVNGELVVEKGTLWDLFRLLGMNFDTLPQPGLVMKTFNRLRQMLPEHSLTASRKNVAHHYDLSERLYRLFLDDDMQYSCAYFARPDMTLEEAQVAKKDHIADKLYLKPGQSVLDIGCGWGGMALHLARRDQVKVTGVTLSTEQLAVATRRAQASGMDGRVDFELCDYRQVSGTYDRIVSVGMFEHVGLKGFDGYFETVAKLLKDDGVALIHTIGRRGPSGGRSAWLDKYIFPGGYIPNLTEMVTAAERSGLFITDIEFLRFHYAETLKHWRDRFMTHYDEVKAMYDERFCRMWEFYLAWCELGFRYSNMMNFQMQLTKRMDALPITRDYMMAREMSANVVDFEKAAGKRRENVRRVIQAIGE
jgi:cyclopropane-fatty-acyl-phospholipid synthase